MRDASRAVRTTDRAPARRSRRAATWLLAVALPAVTLPGTATAAAGPYALAVRADAASTPPLGAPSGVAVDAEGNVFVADAARHVVVRIPAGGPARVVAGNGTDDTAAAVANGKALAVSLSAPRGVALDAAGNLYIADTGNHQVHVVPKPTDWADADLRVLAGTGAPGAPLPGPATASPLHSPAGVAVGRDGAGSALFIADTGNHQVEKVAGAGLTTLSVVAGTGRADAPLPGVATASPLNSPSGVAVDLHGNLFVADRGNHRVEKVTPAGVLSVAAGTGTAGAPVPGPATSSPLRSPSGVAVDPAGNLLVADSGNARVEAVDAAGTLSTVAGTGTAGPATAGGATASALTAPSALAVDAREHVWVADPGAGQLSELTPTTAPSAPAVTSPAPAPAAVGRPWSHTFTARGFPTPTWSAVDALPPWLTLDTRTGVLSGTPTAKATVSVRVRATNPAGHDDQVVALTAGARPPAPSKVTATSTGGDVTLTWTAPTAPGDAPVSGYVVVPSRDGVAGKPVEFSSTATTQVLTGLASGSYTFTVAAVNSFGTGEASAASTPAVAVAGGAGVVAPAAGVHRFDGPDRIATSVRVSRTLFPDRSARAVVVSTSGTYADALGGARLASAASAPLLLTGGATLGADVAAEVKRVLADGGTVHVLGGPGAVSPGVETALKGLSATYQVKRLAGADRYATAVAVAEAVRAQQGAAQRAAAPVYLASGVNFPDGLAVSALAARTGGVVLLTNGPVLPAATKAFLAQQDPAGTRTVPVGGPALAAARQLPAGAAAAAAAQAVTGTDRYDTARLVAARFAATEGGAAAAPVQVVGLATGENWPDALVGSAAMGNLAGPLLLTRGQLFSPAAKDAVTALAKGGKLATGVVFGGRDVVTEATATAFDDVVPAAR
ncbi:hypothetical protein NUM3379_21610 [Kineococcus sp. NUM-3379]